MTITSAHPQALQRSSLHCQPPHAAQRHLLQGRIYLSHYHGQCEAIAAAQIQAAESPETTMSLEARRVVMKAGAESWLGSPRWW